MLSLADASILQAQRFVEMRAPSPPLSCQQRLQDDIIFPPIEGGLPRQHIPTRPGCRLLCTPATCHQQSSFAKLPASRGAHVTCHHPSPHDRADSEMSSMASLLAILSFPCRDEPATSRFRLLSRVLPLRFSRKCPPLTMVCYVSLLHYYSMFSLLLIRGILASVEGFELFQPSLQRLLLITFRQELQLPCLTARDMPRLAIFFTFAIKFDIFH